LSDLQDIQSKKVLISALDWGFGHTTRCAPIISKLIQQGNSIVFAGNEKQNAFISKEFENIKTVFIKGYNIQLNAAKSTYLQIGFQLPKLLFSKLREKQWVKQFLRVEDFDIIISDNRYGFRNRRIKSIFITHQTSPNLPFANKLVSHSLHQWINRFDTCWIPDDPQINLSGKLSQHHLKIEVKYIGILTRFNLIQTSKQFDVLFLVSGPYPESKHFLERIIKSITKHNQFSYCIVSTISHSILINKSITFINSPSTYQLESLINQSNYIVGKCGYTSLMELHSILDRVILFPTKGQFEQEYLAERHHTLSLSETDVARKDLIKNIIFDLNGGSR